MIPDDVAACPADATARQPRSRQTPAMPPCWLVSSSQEIARYGLADALGPWHAGCSERCLIRWWPGRAGRPVLPIRSITMPPTPPSGVDTSQQRRCQVSCSCQRWQVPRPGGARAGARSTSAAECAQSEAEALAAGSSQLPGQGQRANRAKRAKPWQFLGSHVECLAPGDCVLSDLYGLHPSPSAQHGRACRAAPPARPAPASLRRRQAPNHTAARARLRTAVQC